MTTRKSTKRTVSPPKRMYIDYTPDLQIKEPGKYTHYVPFVIEGYTSRKPVYNNYLGDSAHWNVVYDRRGRPLNEFDLIDKPPRHYEVSVPRATYDRAYKKILKIAELRDEADRIRGISGENKPFNVREVSREVMADLARRTRARKRRSGKTSLRR